MADKNTDVVSFDKRDYDRLRTTVESVAKSTQDALWNAEGYSIGPDLHAQPAQATWEIAAKVGSSANKLATQVRTYTDTLCAKTLPDFSESVGKAAEILQNTDNTATDNSKS